MRHLDESIAVASVAARDERAGTLLDEFLHILDSGALQTLYQPIVNLVEHTILGFEALIRGPSDSPLHSPLPLFDMALRSGRLTQLEQTCRALSIAQFRRLRLPGKLFLNTNPASVLQPGSRPQQMLDLVVQAGLRPDDIVLEMTEQFPVDDYEAVRWATREYSRLGFQVAIDDLGAGYAGLRMWSELRPDYVKIDRHFIQGIHDDRVKQEFVRSILNIAHGLDCQVVAEGIETRDEYHTVCALGITSGQGYYFARPQPLPERQLDAELFSCDGVRRQIRRPVRLSETVGSLLRQAPTVSPATQVAEVVELFSATSVLSSVAVLDDAGTPIGLVRRHRLMDVYASPYGHSLHDRKPISKLMDAEPVLVEQDMLVEEVSQVLTEDMRTRVEDNFIITAKGAYLGIGRVVDLLKKITDLQIRNARYANPLTLLPGNVPIYEILDRLLAERCEFAVAYCDLDHFKPFNDVYGYGKGDDVLQRVAAILVQHSDAKLDFVGHLGGDDFILVFRSADWRARCQAMLDQFAAEIALMYEPTDRLQQGIWSSDRSGARMFFPILSLSIGVVLPDAQRCHSHNEVAAMASEAKREAKKQPGNSLFVDRRSAP